MSRAIGWFLVLALVVAGWMKWQVVTLGERLESARQENGRIAATLTDTQWVGPILMTPAWPDRSTWDQYYDYGVQLGSHNTQGFNWNKQCYSNDVRTDWDSGMTWFAIGK